MDIINAHRAKCIKCEQCIEVCPRYDNFQLIENLYGYLEGNKEIDPESLSRCLTCGICKDICPEELGIKILITHSRKKWVKKNGLTDKQTIVDPEAENNIFKKIAEMDKVFTHHESKASVVYFPGCAGTYINKVMEKATIALLEKAGVDYTILDGVEYCCGAVSAGAGDFGTVQRHAKGNIEEIKNREAKLLLTTCPGCFKAFKDIYTRIFGELDFEFLHVSH